MPDPTLHTGPDDTASDDAHMAYWDAQDAGTVEDTATSTTAADAAPEPSESDAKPAEPAVDDAPARDEQGKFKAKDAQARIGELTGKWRDEERKRIALEQRIAEFERPAKPAIPPQPTQPTVESDPEPQLEAFQHDADPWTAHQRALSRWEGRKAAREEFAKLEAQQRQDADTRRTQQQQVEWRRKTDAISAIHADYAAVIAAADTRLAQQGAVVPPGLSAALLASDRGPELAYRLAKEPDVLLEFVDLTRTIGPDSVGLAQRLLETRFPTAPSGSVEKESVKIAPAPIRPVGSAPVAGGDRPPTDDDSDDAHIAYWNRQESQARRRQRA